MQIVVYFHPTMEGRTFDPCASLAYGARYLRQRLNQHGNLRDALAGYSGGVHRYYEDVQAYMDARAAPAG